MSEITDFGFPLKFYKYIFQFRKEKSDRGILARYIISSSLPKNSGLATIKKFMKHQGCSDEMLRILDQVSTDFAEIPSAVVSFRYKTEFLGIKSR